MADERLDAPGEQPDYGLLLPFDSDDPEFVRGFECGRVWSFVQTLDEDDLPSEPLTVHATNAEMVMRIADRNDYRATCEVLDDMWIEVTFDFKDET